MAPTPGEDPRAFDAELRALTDEQRARDAATTRRTERELRHQSALGGTFAGVLRDLGEREQTVVLTGATGRTFTGTIRTIGSDFVALRTANGGAALVPFTAIDSMRPEPGSDRSVGDRAVTVPSSLAAVLAELAEDQTEVSVHTRRGERVRGDLRTAGIDVLVLAAPGSPIYVPISALAAVTVP